MKPTKQYYRELNEQSIQAGKGLMFKEVKCGELSTFSYIHGGIDFQDKRNRLARGLTLDEDNNVVLVGFEKFFCLNQLDNRDFLSQEFLEEFSRLQDKEQYETIEKLDGTMIILSTYKDELITSTTSSVKNEYSDLALDYFLQHEKREEIKEYLKERNSCFIFEYISKYNLIAVEYDTELDFVLLGEVSKDLLQEIQIDNTFDFTLPKITSHTKEELLDIQENGKDIEGFVVINDFGRKIKVKTNWWYEQKEIGTMFFDGRQITKEQIKVIVEAKFNNTLDELYSIENSRNSGLKKVSVIDNIIEEILTQARKLSLKYETARDLNINEKENKLRGFATVIKLEKTIKQDMLVNFILENYRKNLYL